MLSTHSLCAEKPVDLQVKAIEILRSTAKADAREYRNAIRRTRSRSRKAYWATLVKEIDAGKGVVVPDKIKPQELEEGMVCVPLVHHVQIDRIIGENSALVRMVIKGNLVGYETRDVILENYPTSKLTTDQELQYRDEKHPVIYIYGTETIGRDKYLKAVIVDETDSVRFIEPAP